MKYHSNREAAQLGLIGATVGQAEQPKESIPPVLGQEGYQPLPGTLKGEPSQNEVIGLGYPQQQAKPSAGQDPLHGTHIIGRP